MIAFSQGSSYGGVQNRMLPASALGQPIITPPAGMPISVFGPQVRTTAISNIRRPVSTITPTMVQAPARPVGGTPIRTPGIVVSGPVELAQPGPFQLAPSPIAPSPAPSGGTIGPTGSPFYNPIPGSLASSLTGSGTAPQPDGTFAIGGITIGPVVLLVAAAVVLLLVLR